MNKSLHETVVQLSLVFDSGLTVQGKQSKTFGSFHVISPKIKNVLRTLVSNFLYFHTNYSFSTQKKKSKV